MTYKEIRNEGQLQKKSHYNQRMDLVKFDRFSVMQSGKTGSIIIDNEIAKIAMNRKWCIDSSGYPVANIRHELIRLHDFIMAHYFDEKPSGCYIDHINQDKLDNRIINLRFVTPLESSLNMPLKSNNTSGYTGVSKTKNNTYRAYINANKKRIELGHYKTLEEAIKARREAEERLGYNTRPLTIKEILHS